MKIGAQGNSDSFIKQWPSSKSTITMTKRTQIEQYQNIEKATDLEKIVVDKRSGKRANKSKAKRRNRHYTKTLMKHLSQDCENQ
jgi:hypothetical protein